MKKLLCLLVLSTGCSYLLSTTFTVTNTADSGAGSLRAAITAANADVTASRSIVFAIPGAGPHTISPATALPSIVKSTTTIDGTTQAGWTAATPQIVIAGDGSFSFDGLTIDGVNNCTIKGIVVNGGFAKGIIIKNTANNNAVFDCFVGTDATGTAASPNSIGIQAIATSGFSNDGTLIGAANQGNLVSGNNAAGFGAGIVLSGNITHAKVQGNKVGTNQAGTAAIPNAAVGLAIASPTFSDDTTVLADNNTIGGSGAGEGNLVSGNETSGFAPGIAIAFQTANNTTIEGNVVGLDSTGLVALPNDIGIVTFWMSPLISATGTVVKNNIVSGNLNGGLILQVSVNNSIIQGNFIGTDGTGTIALGNHGDALAVQGNNNIIGGSTAATRNIISNNSGSGISLANGSSNNTIQGNYVGVNAAGTVAMGNGNNGIEISGYNSSTNTPNPSNNNAITNNIIANSTSSGISLNLGCNDTVIKGNKIGVNTTGAVAAPNGQQGILIQGYNFSNQAVVNCDRTIIGGSLVSERNIISANGSSGILINLGCNDTVVKNNYIGVDTSGAINLGNGNIGVQIQGYDFTNKTSVPCNNTVIGGGAGEGNIISGSTNQGISINLACNNTVIKGNKIGVNGAGSAALPNGQQGILIIGFDFSPPGTSAPCNNTIIGGTPAAERNIISGNSNAGIQYNTDVNNSTIVGNYIGVDATGSSALPNGQQGIYINGNTQAACDGNSIGGSAAGSANIISANGSDGIFLQNNVSNTSIIGNYIGTNAASSITLGNTNSGIHVGGDTSQPCDGTIIGSIGAGNVIGKNGGNGIFLQNNVNNTEIVGNYIGTDPASSVTLGNGGVGIYVNGNTSQPCDGTIIGGSAAGAGNVIGNNANDGIFLQNNVTNSVIQGNFVGTDAAETTNIGNLNDGIQISGSFNIPCTNNLIGGTTTSVHNVITNNAAFGVDIGGDPTTPDILNPILGNSIFANTNSGINLQNNGNDNQEAPVINAAALCTSNNALQVAATAPVNPAASTFRLEFFLNTADRNPITEGESFVGAITPVASGASASATFSVPAALVGQWVSATATNLNPAGPLGMFGDTSEFTLNTLIASDAPIPVLAAVPTAICPSGSSTLTLTITGTGPYDLTWSDGLVQTGQTSPVMRVVSPAHTTTYSVLVTDANGCQAHSNNVTVTVTEIALTALPTTICATGSSTLTATFGGVPPFDLAWSDGEIDLNVTSPFVRTVSPGTTTMYTVTLTDASGCAPQMASATVTVNPLPVATLTATPPAICAGESSDLTLNIVGTGPYNLAWSDGVMQTGVTSPVMRTVTPTVTTVYSVVVTDSNGCQASSNTASVTVNPLPTVTLIASSPSAVPGESITLTATPSGGPPFTLTWSDGLVQTGVTGPVSRDVTITAPTTFSVVATNVNGCNSAPASVFVSLGRISPIVAAILHKYCPFASGS